jgi:crotonobetainyl-CoA:carnitine CoA-transferase CaiB-like acyl-CoA transferase
MRFGPRGVVLEVTGKRGRMAGPLAGLRVIDCSTGMAGPRATGMLADYGADVLWVEPPGGDRFREELAIPYSVFNRGKRSIELDLHEDAERERLFEWLAGADVFVESWRPGVADGLGLGYDRLHELFPSLIYCSISGFGEDGPHRDTPGYEAIVHALIGTMGEQPGVRPAPIFEGLPFASIGASYLASIVICAALNRREDDGVGRWVRTSLVDGALVYLTMLWGDADVPLPPRDPGSRRLIARNFVCAEGDILGVHTGAVGAFGRLMRVLQLDDRVPASESGLDMAIPLTAEQRTVLDESLPEIFASKPRDEWVQLLVEADICAIPLLQPLDVFDEPQVIHNQMVMQLEDPLLGPIDQVAPALRFSLTAPDPPAPAPVVGSARSSAPGTALRGGGPTGDVIDDRPLLAGLKVLDLGAYYAGPYASRLLADLGADVIRVEALYGDPNRGTEALFRASHSGKRSIALDLKQSEAQSIMRELLRWADVAHHSMRPGADERLGIGYEQVRSVNPEIVYAHGPGWGSSGPLTLRQSFAPLMSGFVGAAYEAAGQWNEPVYPAGNEDPGNGLLGALGILLAVFHKRRTGSGQFVEHPQLNAALSHMAHIVRRPDRTVLGALRLDPVQLGVGPLERLYETSDGWVCLVAKSHDEISGLGKVLGLDLFADERFASFADRERNADVLADVVANSFAEWSTPELLTRLHDAGVPAEEPVPHNNRNFLRDPENLRSGRSAEHIHLTSGKVRQVGLLMHASHSVPAPQRMTPTLGEHTDEILGSLQFSSETIAAWRERKVIG